MFRAGLADDRVLRLQTTAELGRARRIRPPLAVRVPRPFRMDGRAASRRTHRQILRYRKPPSVPGMHVDCIIGPLPPWLVVPVEFALAAFDRGSSAPPNYTVVSFSIRHGCVRL
jgi:hypothetical protein